MGYAELEIGLQRWDEQRYHVALRFSPPDEDVDFRRTPQDMVQFDFRRLEQEAYDPARYGRILTQSLFAEPEARTLFAQARSVAQRARSPLRMRLLIDAEAPELHSLHWEKLCDPADERIVLANDENIHFSRYLLSHDWRPVPPRPQETLRVLVVVANPEGLDEYQPGGQPLAALDVAAELERARASLGPLEVRELPSLGRATLENLITHLRDGYDVLYLVCHGAFLRDEPRLWLENESGHVEVVSGSEMVTRLRGLVQQPRLVVLASCQSAGTGETGGPGATGRRGDQASPSPRPVSPSPQVPPSPAARRGSLAALGPQLAQAGIPAVVAMQGNLTMETAGKFMPVFFRELQRDGQIDRAMAAARGSVLHRPDHWMPVLYTRLRSGRLWEEPGFEAERPDFTRWGALVSNISAGRCTPILGSGLLKSLIGSSQEIGRCWAATYRFPMARHAWENLPQVAQYLAVDQDPFFPRDRLRHYIQKELLRRKGKELPEELRREAAEKLIPEKLLSAAGAQLRKADPSEPHRILAEMPCPVYITTNPDNLLEEALEEAGRKPRRELFDWALDAVSREGADGNTAEPSVEEPLVYHLFGHFSKIDSLVLTEDDYFDYLIGAARNKDLIPATVRDRLAASALLFLGFQLDDWSFRVLFRFIATQEGWRSRHRRSAHVGVQIDPMAGRALDPERARSYLQRYFEEEAINLYWGSVEEFLKELQQQRAW